MPQGPIDASTLASSSVTGIEEKTFYPSRYGQGLRSGWNVLAIEVHQVSRMSNDLSFAGELLGLRPGTMLLPRGSVWRFRGNGVIPNPSWKTPGFDDSHWAFGPAQFGWGEDDEATKVTQGLITFYFRTTFSVAQASAVRWLSCRLLRDDGALIYLNGVLAARLNLPRTLVLDGTYASFNVDEDQEVWTSNILDPRLLVEGTNTIAVEMHDSAAMSDDLSFDLELVAY